jgi:hypothetical protein
MKLSSHLAKLKLEKIKAAELKPVPGKRAQGALKYWVALIICLLFAAVGTWRALAIFVWDKLPTALIGKWEVQDGPMKGGTFAFSRNGSVEIRAPGTNDKINARVAVEGKILLTTTQNPSTRKDETRKSIIQELTENSLILELERGAVLRMARMH